MKMVPCEIFTFYIYGKPIMYPRTVNCSSYCNIYIILIEIGKLENIARVGDECNIFLMSTIFSCIILNKTVNIIIIIYIRLFHSVHITKIKEIAISALLQPFWNNDRTIFL